MTLYYGDVTPDRLVADVDTLAKGLAEGAVLRVTFDGGPEILIALSALCAERSYILARSQSLTSHVGDRMGHGRLFYDIRPA